MEKNTRLNCREEEADLMILASFSLRLLLATGYFWLETIMEIRSRHIGNQEHPGLPALLSSPFEGAVFLWQLANMFPSFATNSSRVTDIIGYPEFLNYIQLPKFRMFVRRITESPRKCLRVTISRSILE